MIQFYHQIFLSDLAKTMTIDDEIKDKGIQYDIIREATKMSALSSGKN